MRELFPEPPGLSSARQRPVAVTEWVMPGGSTLRRWVGLHPALPRAMPDCLEVNLIHREEGSERSVAAVYGNRSYLIHLEFL